jgi:hypothetical protein
MNAISWPLGTSGSRTLMGVPALAALGLLCHLGTAQASATQRACSAMPLSLCQLTDNTLEYAKFIN